MKKLFLHFVLPCTIIAAAILSIGISCGPGPGPTIASYCDTVNSPFNTLYSSLKANPLYQERNTIDLTTREYVFELTGGNTKVCSIGYQAEPGVVGGTYQISIIDNGTTLFTGNLSFSTANMSYVSISPVQLQLNRPYTLRRVALNYGGNIANTIGICLSNATGAPLTLPLIGTNIKITQTSFYGSGGPINNLLVPKIDFATQP